MYTVTIPPFIVKKKRQRGCSAIDGVETAVTSTFSAQAVNAKSTADSVKQAVVPLQSRFTSTLTATDQGATQTAWTVMTNVKPVNNRFTAMLEAQDQGASQTAGTVSRAVTPINNRLIAMLETEDQATPTINEVKQGLDGIKYKRVQGDMEVQTLLPVPLPLWLVKAFILRWFQ